MTFLQHLGSALKKVLHIGEEAAIIAAPIVTIAFPEIAPLYTSTIGLAVTSEASAAAATGTGPQKLQQLMTGLMPAAQQWATQNGINWPQGEIQKWASAVVDTVNLIPAPTQSPVTPPAPISAP